MSYSKHTWSNGDTITANLLNNMEQGIEDAGSGGGAFIVNLTPSTKKDSSGNSFDSDKTGLELYEAWNSNIPCYFQLPYEGDDMFIRIPVLSAYSEEPKDGEEGDISYYAYGALDLVETIVIIEVENNIFEVSIEEAESNGLPWADDHYDGGKVVTYNASKDRYELETPRYVPEFSNNGADDDKVLTVVHDFNGRYYQLKSIRLPTTSLGANNSFDSSIWDDSGKETGVFLYSIDGYRTIRLYYTGSYEDMYYYTGFDNQTNTIYKGTATYGFSTMTITTLQLGSQS